MSRPWKQAALAICEAESRVRHWEWLLRQGAATYDAARHQDAIDHLRDGLLGVRCVVEELLAALPEREPEGEPEPMPEKVAGFISPSVHG